MQEENELWSRRGVLRLGLQGLAATGALALAPVAKAQEASARVKPMHPVTLRTSSLEMSLDGVSGVPYEYLLTKSGLRFAGESKGLGFKTRVCCREPWSFVEQEALPISQQITGTRADFRFRVMYAGKVIAAEFTLRYEVADSTVRLTMEEVREHAGFELISVSMPELVTVSESDSGAWLAHGDSGGDLVALKEARAGHLAPNTFWGEVQGVLPVTMAGHSGAVCVQETTACMDGTLLSVQGDAPTRRVAMGTTKVYRVDGGGCYDMNLGKGAPKSCGNKAAPNLLVGQKSSCRFDFLEPAKDCRALTWLDGARLVRSRMPRIPNRSYDDKFIYGIRTDEPKFPQPSATFERCEEIIARIHALTDGSPQLVHLWGWQYKGKDTGYPAVDVVDTRIGGYNGMMRLKDKVEPLNVTLSLSDNYDDAYRSSPAWNEAMIARKPDGELWKSREWTGEESYIQGLAKYMDGPGVERVRYTCERYKLPGTIHVDVLSYFAIRNDWDPKHPASGIRNLYAGRYRVLEEFARHGVDVTSEGLRYPYIGKMSMAWYAGGPNPCPFGGKPVPMLSLIYRQSAVWGRANNHGELPFQLMMFYGEAHHAIVNGDTPINDMLDSFYLAMVPWFRINHTNVEGFERRGDHTVTELEGNGNRIEIDWSSRNYKVMLDGAAVAEAGATYCPLGPNRIAMYSVVDQTLTATLPDSWQASGLTAAALLPDRREAVKFSVNGREVSVEMKARQPVMIYRSIAPLA